MREEDRLADILFEWRERRERGDFADPESVIREHPDLADRLRSWFLALAAVDEVLSESPVLGQGVPDRLGNYRLLCELGAGGMGTVYLAESDGKTEFDRVALKILHPHLLANPGTLSRFEREARAGLAIRHENVLRTLDVGVHVEDGRDFHYLVLEYVEGRTLRELLLDLTTVPEALLREIAAQVVAGVAAIHKAGLVHRDLKPDNIVITPDRRVRIMDLGIARLIDGTMDLTREGQFAGSLLYASPEQVAGKPVGPAADLYAIGVTLYELATGKNPFRRASVPAIVHAQLHHRPPRARELSAELSMFITELISVLLEKDPERRLGSAARLESVLASGERSAWWAERERDILDAESRMPRVPVRRETEITGRDEELDTMRAAWISARGGDGRTLLITGEAGIGKSRLIDEFLRGLEPEEANVLYGSYSPFGGKGALTDAVLGRFGETSLIRSLATYLPTTARLVPAFAAALRSEGLPSGAERLEGDALNTVFCRLAGALARERPMIWVVEDLHNAPGGSLGIIESLVRAHRGERSLLILSARAGFAPEFESRIARAEGCRRLPLSRLSPREVIGLLRDTLKSPELADRLGAKIAYQSDGVPFFICEMIRGLEEGQFITEQADGSFAETKAVDRIETPEAVRELVAARLLGLSRLERSILDVGAVMGFEFDPGVVARVREMKRFEVLECLAHLERRSGVVRGAEGVCRFDHHQIQDVLYAELPPDLRAEYHALVAACIADREGARGPEARSGELAVVLATHSLKGSRPEAAIPHINRALDHLAGELRHEEAVALADRALARAGLLVDAERARLLLRQAAILDTLGRNADERAALDEALGLAARVQDPSLVAAGGWRLGAWLIRNGNALEARVHVVAAVRAARSAADPTEEENATRILGVACRMLGRYEEAVIHDRRAIELAQEIGDLNGEAGATVNLGIALEDLGRKEEARATLERGRALARRAGNRVWEANAAMTLNHLLVDLGRVDEALGRQEEDLAFCRSSGYRWGEAVALGHLGELHRWLGRYGKAVDYFRRALALDGALNRRAGEGGDSASLGELALLLGGVEDAGELGQQAVRCARETADRFNEGHAILLLGRVAMAEGRLEDAAGRFERALDLRKERRHPPGIAVTTLALGEVATLRGDTAGAEALLTEAGRLGRELDLPSVFVPAAARLAALTGRWGAEAAALFEEARPRLGHPERLEARYLLWRATGEVAHLEAAKRLLSEVVATAPEEYRAGLTERVAIYREVLRGG